MAGRVDPLECMGEIIAVDRASYVSIKTDLGRVIQIGVHAFRMAFRWDSNTRELMYQDTDRPVHVGDKVLLRFVRLADSAIPVVLYVDSDLADLSGGEDDEQDVFDVSVESMSVLDGYMRLGASTFYVPPSMIKVNRIATVEEQGVLRSKTTVKKGTGHSDVMITIDVVFPSPELVNDPDNGLRALIAQFKRTPFVPVINKFLNYAHNIEAVCLHDLTVQTIEHFPGALQATITCFAFDHTILMPDELFFVSTIDWDLFRWYYKRNLVDGKCLLEPVTGIDSSIDFYYLPEDKLQEWVESRRSTRVKYNKQAALQDAELDLKTFNSAMKAYDKVSKEKDATVRDPRGEYMVVVGREAVYRALWPQGHMPKVDPKRGEYNVAIFFRFYNENNQYIGDCPYGVSDLKTYLTTALVGNWNSLVLASVQGGWLGGLATIQSRINHALASAKQDYERALKDIPPEIGAEWQLEEYMQPWPLQDKAILTNIAVSYRNLFARIPMQMHEFPAYQFFGSQGAYAKLTMEVIGDDVVAQLRQLFEYAQLLAREYRYHITSSFLRVSNEILGLFGIKNVIIDSMSCQTVPNFPDRYLVELTVMDFDVYQSRRTGGEVINKSGTDPVIRFDASSSDNDNSVLLPGYITIDKSPEGNISYVIKIEKLFSSIDLYPDLELPTYDELPADKRPMVELKRRGNAKYVDPDFYFVNTSGFRSTLNDVLQRGPTAVLRDKEGNTLKVRSGAEQIHVPGSYDNEEIPDSDRVAFVVQSVGAEPPQASQHTTTEEPAMSSRSAQMNMTSLVPEGSAVISHMKYVQMIADAIEEVRVYSGVEVPLEYAVILAQSESSLSHYKKSGSVITNSYVSSGRTVEVAGLFQVSLDLYGSDTAPTWGLSQANFAKTVNPWGYTAEEIKNDVGANIRVGLMLYATNYKTFKYNARFYQDYYRMLRQVPISSAHREILDGISNKMWLCAAQRYKGVRAATSTETKVQYLQGYLNAVQPGLDAVSEYKSIMSSRNYKASATKTGAQASAVPALAGTTADDAGSEHLETVPHMQQYGSGEPYKWSVPSSIGAGQAKQYYSNAIHPQEEWTPQAQGLDHYWENAWHDALSYEITGSMLKAFPTMHVFLIDEGKRIQWYRLWDNFYGTHAITNIDIVRSRKSVADTALLTISNVYSRFTDETEVQFEDHKFTLGQFIWTRPDHDMERVRSIFRESVGLAAGARVHIRLGYGNNLEELPIVFNGTITEVEVGDIINVIAQGDGIELTSELKFPEQKVAGFLGLGGEPRNLLTRLLMFGDMPGGLTEPIRRLWRSLNGPPQNHPVVHFGSPDVCNSLYWASGEIGQNIYPGNGNGKLESFGGIEGMVGLNLSNDEYNVEVVLHGKTIADIAQILAKVIPNYVVSVEPFEFRSTLFYGKPQWDITYGYELSQLPSKDAIPVMDPKDPNKHLYYIVPKKKPFMQWHLYTSYGHIISNKIRATSEGMYTGVVATLKADSATAFVNRAMELSVEAHADRDIYPQFQRITTVSSELYSRKPFAWSSIITGIPKYLQRKCVTLTLAQNLAANTVCDYMKDMYQGELLILGDPTVKPHDCMYIADCYTDMSGCAMVKEVVHSLSADTGYVTHVRPDAAAAVIEDESITLLTWGGSVGATVAGEWIVAAMLSRKARSMVASQIATNPTARTLLGRFWSWFVRVSPTAGNYVKSLEIHAAKLANTATFQKYAVPVLQKVLPYVSRTAAFAKSLPSKVVSWLSRMLNIGNAANTVGSAAAAGGLGAAVVAAAPYVIFHLCVMFFIQGLFADLQRYIKSGQCIAMSLLTLNGKEFSAGINGHRGLVVGLSEDVVGGSISDRIKQALPAWVPGVADQYTVDPDVVFGKILNDNDQASLD